MSSCIMDSSVFMLYWLIQINLTILAIGIHN